MDLLKILSRDRTCRATTGLTRRNFFRLLGWFERELDRISKQKNPRGSGRKSPLLTCRDKLFFVVYYLKNYPTFDVLGANFNMDRTRACREVHFLCEVLMTTLRRVNALPVEAFRSKKHFMKKFPGLNLVIADGTERRRRRPQNARKQREFYSGKKKTHTLKNLVITDSKKQILFVSETVPGKTADKTLFFE
jgi:hypothetical protein